MEYKHKIIKIWYSIYTISTIKNNYYRFEESLSFKQFLYGYGLIVQINQSFRPSLYPWPINRWKDRYRESKRDQLLIDFHSRSIMSDRPLKSRNYTYQIPKKKNWKIQIIRQFVLSIANFVNKSSLVN